MNTSTILAIESSCDETACAIVTRVDAAPTAHILFSTTATSLAKHKATKGIVPEIAAREQLKYILPVLTETLGSTPPQLDAIAVTVGPGLAGSLLVGIETARALAMAWELPIIPVNHIQAHPYANFVAATDELTSAPQFPLLSWVISGGHTELHLMNSHEEIIRLGRTVDDAAGECFDKCARVLGFDYPGGPFIQQLADSLSSLSKDLADELSPIKLPRPLLHEKTYDMSFSGLKTAFLRSFRENQEQDPQLLKAILATELQNAISEIIWKRTARALEQFPQVNSIIISGGVAANKAIRSTLQGQLVKNYPHITLHVPPLSLCTDNAAMIGSYAVFHTEKKSNWEHVSLQLH